MSKATDSSLRVSKLANPGRERKRLQRYYSDEDRYIALAAVDLNGAFTVLPLLSTSRQDFRRLGESSR
jgi:hypothetical protein